MYILSADPSLFIGPNLYNKFVAFPGISGVNLFWRGKWQGKCLMSLKHARCVLDVIDHGVGPIVSRKFRDALNASPEQVEYLPVTLVDSVSEAHEMSYMKMFVKDVQDLAERSEIDVTPVRDKLAAVGITEAESFMQAQWGRLVEGIKISESTEMSGRICADRIHISSNFVSEEAALDLLNSGCTGFVLNLPQYLSSASGMYFKTLRGIEELDSYDKKNKRWNSRLIGPTLS